MYSTIYCNDSSKTNALAALCGAVINGLKDGVTTGWIFVINCGMQQTIRIIVSGKVQGVFYRQSTHEKAEGLGITGTVRNLPDDTVEILATGHPQQLHELLAWCRQGPPRAVVTGVQSTEITLQTFKGFRVLR
ncbi:MAG TPA: acylphosphatase [Chitinophagaceae bacterium]|nr:acylphosphatase [Chitinophagaceae bacterium]